MLQRGGLKQAVRGAMARMILCPGSALNKRPPRLASSLASVCAVGGLLWILLLKCSFRSKKWPM